MKKKVLIIIILMIVLTSFLCYRVKIKNLWLNLTKQQLPEAVKYQDIDDDLTNDLPQQDSGQVRIKLALNEAEVTENQPPTLNLQLPTSYNLNVPFTPQAPLADWNETFKEACEEAAALIVHYYYQDKTFTAEIATDEILKMVDWQIENWGGHFDLTASQTAQLIKDYWSYEKIEVIDNPTVNDIKYHISEKRPVIVPAAGRELGNPYFRQPGPIYHMLVIKGYTETQFITNDPGTKRGKDFLYDYEIIMNAMHDWNEQNILQGEKRIIVIFSN